MYNLINFKLMYKKTKDLTKLLAIAFMALTTVFGTSSCSSDDDDNNKTSVIPLVINKSSVTIEKGQKDTLYVSMGSATGTMPTISWKSSNSSVALVSWEGVVTAIAGGQATITASSLDGKYVATCEVTVLSYPTGIELSESNVTIDINTSKTLTATILPKDASPKDVVWKSDDESIAVVDANGVVTAKGKGSTTITATSVYGSFSASCTVTVNIPVENVEFGEAEVTLITGQSYTPIVKISPSDASNMEYTLSSSKTDIVSVEDGVLKALKLGEAEITVITKDGSKVAKCTVTVVSPYDVDYTPYDDSKTW